jgi:hypothetical protein
LRRSKPLLPGPVDPLPLCRLKNRRKTLAIHRTGFMVRRSSSRINDKCRVRPIVKEAEALVCRNLRIIMDGEVVMERALDIFVAIFKEEISWDAVRALPYLMKRIWIGLLPDTYDAFTFGNETSKSDRRPYPKRIFHLWMALRVIYSFVGGQIGPKKVVGDGNLTYFIIRYRYELTRQFSDD